MSVLHRGAMRKQLNYAGEELCQQSNSSDVQAPLMVLDTSI